MIGPVFLELGAFGNPAAKGFLLFGRKNAFKFGGGHDLVRVVRKDAIEKFTVLGFTRHHGDCPVAGGGGGSGLIQTKFRLAGLGIGPVALETMRGQDGSNIVVE